MDDNYETVQGFLVVEKVMDHPNLKYAGVLVGDICLSWGTRYPEAPETLSDAWIDFLKWGRSDEDVCWFARDNGGKIEVFQCDAGLLYECMVSLGTFGLALKPTAFPKEAAERIRAAASARKAANMAERAELLTLSPPLQEGINAFGFAFKTDDGAWRGRVDTMQDNLDRLALWRRNRSLSALPDLVAEVTWRPDGSGGNGSYEPVGSGNDPRFAHLFEFNLGTDETPQLVLVMRTPGGEERKLVAQRASWWDLRIEQAASEPDPFVPERPEPGLEKTLHPSLVRIPFEPVLCFEADDGTIAGRIDHLPTKDLAEWREPWKTVDFDDKHRIYRIALFKCPVKAGAKPQDVFYATRRVNGTSGTHTYVDASWWYSLDVDVGEVDPPGTFLTALELKRWPVASPEIGWEDLEKSGGACIPAHLIRWKDICQVREDVNYLETATEEQRDRWDNGVSGARGHFRGVPFELRDGQAVVTAPAGNHWFLTDDYSVDPDSGEPAKSHRWLLETYPQWSVSDARRTYFVLHANAMDNEGRVGFGETADEDTLLLFWRNTDKTNGDWSCAFLGNRLRPLVGNMNAVSLNGKWLSIETTWRSTGNGGHPVIYKLKESRGEIGAMPRNRPC